ncbi:uncharacterized protein LOC132205592 [Neocloeon triangulifer]|uniref:uncharacterized protein LOC132205592 n=1 Tax=Neocloeon triangulifer TaxID=2078957 RepID=UPI00286EFCD1|nr:uncharacterized protein LOC132205592 [Neocloeon triangulifer]
MSEADLQRPNMAVSRMPWIPANIGDMKLEDSVFFRDIMATREDKGQRGLKLLSLLQKTFPYYLPKRYHQMDCPSLLEKSTDAHWLNAFHYLICTQAYGSLYTNAIEKLLRSEDRSDFDETPLTSYLCQVTNKMLQGSLDVCESVDEILFEPWILLQLPFNSKLLQQWHFAYLAELLRFQKECVDFHFMTFPPELTITVIELLKLEYELLINGIGLFKKMYTIIVTYDPLRQTTFRNALLVEDFKRIIGRTLSQLRFITSKKCKKLLYDLKRMAWNGRNSGYGNRYQDLKGDSRHAQLLSLTGVAGVADIKHVFAYKFWRTDLVIADSLKSGNVTVEDEMISHAQVKLPFEEEIEKKIKKLAPADVFAFVGDKVIKTGRLKGASFEAMMKELEAANKDDYKLMGHCYLMYHHFIETSSQAKGLQDSNFGVIHQLNTLCADMHLSVALAALVEITEFSINLRGKMKVFKNFPTEDNGESKFPESELRKQMLRTLACVEKDKTWDFEKILATLRKECKNTKSAKRPLLESGIDGILKNLESRIKKILLNMIEDQMGQFKGPPRIHPEMSTVQYILPCFVAEIIPVYNCSNLQENQKKQFLNVIHELVKTYERCEFYECHEKPFAALNPSMRILLVHRSHMLAITFLWVELRKKLAVAGFFPVRFVNCLHSLVDSVVKIKDYYNEIRAENFSWPLQVYLLLYRLMSALETVCPADCFTTLDLSVENNHKCLLLAKMMDIFRIKLPKSVTELIDRILVEASTAIGRAFWNHNFPLLQFEHVTTQQLIGVVLFMLMSNLDKASVKVKPEMYEYLQRFTLDPVQNTYFNVVEGKLWEAKMTTSMWLSSSDGSKDLSMVTLAEAKVNRDCYRDVLASLTKDGKVPMKKPGQINFCPIQHCRWCGQADGVKDFLVCDECSNNPEYPDKNFFCSKTCLEAMQEQHIEEHAQFCLMKMVF